MPSPAAAVAVDADGWAEVGVIVDPDHGHDWRVQLHVGTGAGRLGAWARRVPERRGCTSDPPGPV